MTPSLVDYEKFLTQKRIPVRLGCQTESGWPAVLSLWYIYQEGKIYCATRRTARVVSYLETDPRCAFEIAADTPPYCGIRGQAQGKIIHDRGEEILELLIQRYLGGQDNQLARNLLKFRQEEVALEITPVNVFQWDFSARMEDVAQEMLSKIEKVCP
jgi:nitroimidazol reductase NimA-like FMN-containing flavoprotein (pyridoxamine 5'-phosphate oxidase superfamily)